MGKSKEDTIKYYPRCDTLIKRMALSLGDVSSSI